MTPIEKRKVQLELHRVEAARMDMEIRAEEMKEEIKRLEGHMAIQEAKEKELKQVLSEN